MPQAHPPHQQQHGPAPAWGAPAGESRVDTDRLQQDLAAANNQITALRAHLAHLEMESSELRRKTPHAPGAAPPTVSAASGQRHATSPFKAADALIAKVQMAEEEAATQRRRAAEQAAELAAMRTKLLDVQQQLDKRLEVEAHLEADAHLLPGNKRRRLPEEAGGVVAQGDRRLQLSPDAAEAAPMMQDYPPERNTSGGATAAAAPHLQQRHHHRPPAKAVGATANGAAQGLPLQGRSAAATDGGAVAAPAAAAAVAAHAGGGTSEVSADGPTTGHAPAGGVQYQPALRVPGLLFALREAPVWQVLWSACHCAVAELLTERSAVSVSGQEVPEDGAHSSQAAATAAAAAAEAPSHRLRALQRMLQDVMHGRCEALRFMLSLLSYLQAAAAQPAPVGVPPATAATQAVNTTPGRDAGARDGGKAAAAAAVATQAVAAAPDTQGGSASSPSSSGAGAGDEDAVVLAGLRVLETLLRHVAECRRYAAASLVIQARRLRGGSSNGMVTGPSGSTGWLAGLSGQATVEEVPAGGRTHGSVTERQPGSLDLYRSGVPLSVAVDTFLRCEAGPSASMAGGVGGTSCSTSVGGVLRWFPLLVCHREDKRSLLLPGRMGVTGDAAAAASAGRRTVGGAAAAAVGGTDDSGAAVLSVVDVLVALYEACGQEDEAVASAIAAALAAVADCLPAPTLRQLMAPVLSCQLLPHLLTSAAAPPPSTSTCYCHPLPPRMEGLMLLQSLLQSPQLVAAMRKVLMVPVGQESGDNGDVVMTESGLLSHAAAAAAAGDPGSAASTSATAADIEAAARCCSAQVLQDAFAGLLECLHADAHADGSATPGLLSTHSCYSRRLLGAQSNNAECPAGISGGSGTPGAGDGSGSLLRRRGCSRKPPPAAGGAFELQRRVLAVVAPLLHSLSNGGSSSGGHDGTLLVAYLCRGDGVTVSHQQQQGSPGLAQRLLSLALVAASNAGGEPYDPQAIAATSRRFSEYDAATALTTATQERLRLALEALALLKDVVAAASDDLRLSALEDLSSGFEPQQLFSGLAKLYDWHPAVLLAGRFCPAEQSPTPLPLAPWFHTTWSAPAVPISSTVSAAGGTRLSVWSGTPSSGRTVRSLAVSVRRRLESYLKQRHLRAQRARSGSAGGGFAETGSGSGQVDTCRP